MKFTGNVLIFLPKLVFRLLPQATARKWRQVNQQETFSCVPVWLSPPSEGKKSDPGNEVGYAPGKSNEISNSIPCPLRA